MTAVALVAGNALALSVWLAPVQRARIDLTERGEYSLSATTTDLLRSLDQPLLVRAAARRRPTPSWRRWCRASATCRRYRIAGGASVRVEGGRIRARTTRRSRRPGALQHREHLPVRFASRTEQSVLSVFFHILVQYGDHHEVLSFSDLIDVRPVGVDEVEVGLKNFEYDLTKTIKKVAMGFQASGALFASLPGQVGLTTYATPASLPEGVAAPALIAQVLDGFKATAGDKLVATTVEPSGEARCRSCSPSGASARTRALVGQRPCYP
ncbi:MAG: Gldg family protein [Kofleriaceae bacterium]